MFNFELGQRDRVTLRVVGGSWRAGEEPSQPWAEEVKEGCGGGGWWRRQLPTTAGWGSKLLMGLVGGRGGKRRRLPTLGNTANQSAHQFMHVERVLNECGHGQGHVSEANVGKFLLPNVAAAVVAPSISCPSVLGANPNGGRKGG